MSELHTCGTPWKISRGPGRVVGSIAKSIHGIAAPLPADLEYEYCPKCNVRNMTPALEAKLLEIEQQHLDRLENRPNLARTIRGTREREAREETMAAAQELREATVFREGGEWCEWVIGGVDALALTHLDTLSLGISRKIPICTAYSFDSEPDRELFQTSSNKATGILVHRPASLEHQTKLTEALFTARPECEEVFYPLVRERLEELLGGLNAPVKLTSWGPTATDKLEVAALARRWA